MYPPDRVKTVDPTVAQRATQATDPSTIMSAPDDLLNGDPQSLGSADAVGTLRVDKRGC